MSGEPNKPIAIGPPVVVRVHRRSDPGRLQRVAAILLDIIDHANALDSQNNPDDTGKRC